MQESAFNAVADANQSERRQFLRSSLLLSIPALLPSAPSSAMAAATHVPSDGRETIADTTYGKVRGVLTPDGVRTFCGIPYGGDTGGANRFKPPTKPASWTGVRDAVQWGNKSPQIAAAGQATTIMYLDYTEGGLGRQSEDCLVLNVWSKAGRDGGKRPVMVRIHGGGFSTGTGNHPMYWGHASAKRGDVIYVSMNHRLGALGYLDLSQVGGAPYAHSGNAGMLDLVAALEWVRDNAENFGGDPNNVMIMGESGGGRKVSTLLGMPSAKGLFHRAVVESGSLLSCRSASASAATTARFFSRLGLKESQYQDLLRLPVNRLLEADVLMNNRMYPGDPAVVGFFPVTDGAVVPREPFSPDANPLSADVPMIIGYNQDEGTFIMQADEDFYSLDEAGLRKRVDDRVGRNADQIISAYRAVFPHATPTTLMDYIARDSGYGHNAVLQSERHAALNKAKTYMYRFNWQTPAFNGKYGTPHGTEIVFVTGDPSHMDVLTHNTPEAQALAANVNAAWVAFAKTGDPNTAALPHWEPYATDARATMFLDNQSALVNDPESQIRRLWADLKFEKPLNGDSPTTRESPRART
jgi:para-nitrobenzyl esterase